VGGRDEECATILRSLSRSPAAVPAAAREWLALSRSLLSRRKIEAALESWLDAASAQGAPSPRGLELGRRLWSELMRSPSGPELWRLGVNRRPAARRAADCVELCASGGRRQDAAASAQGPVEDLVRFETLMNAGEFSQAFALGERILDRRPGVEILRRLQLPWTPGRIPAVRDAFGPALLALARAAQSPPWARYYNSMLNGSALLVDLSEPLQWPRERYGWMLLWLGRLLLMGERYADASKILEQAACVKPPEWRVLGWQAETYACLGRRGRIETAFRHALAVAPAAERAQVVAWRGAIALWRGDYARAERDLLSSARERADWSFCWLGGLWTVTGRLPEALESLRHALILHPSDPEAKAWLGEALRRLGRLEEAVGTLEGSRGLWATLNRALARAESGDAAGFDKDWSSLPADILARSPESGASRSSERRAYLESLLKSARGCRRDDRYLRPVWLK
jgi:tetratricopeptide (TPR) repeat protein